MVARYGSGDINVKKTTTKKQKNLKVNEQHHSVSDLINTFNVAHYTSPPHAVNECFPDDT